MGLLADLDSVKIGRYLVSVKIWSSAMPADRYHHGNLRPALLAAAAELTRAEGVEGLSLRRLAERTGVSRSALYHHFCDKHDLLCALAADGFRALESLVEAAPLAPGAELPRSLRAFVRSYIGFAAEDPQRYELMFGRTLWKSGPTPELREVAYRSFRRYRDRITALLPASDRRRALRVAQASWATLHGLCRLLLDGIYVDRADMDEIDEQVAAAVVIMLQPALRKPCVD
jgi:AcrR family transcriptional regulator